MSIDGCRIAAIDTWCTAQQSYVDREACTITRKNFRPVANLTEGQLVLHVQAEAQAAAEHAASELAALAADRDAKLAAAQASPVIVDPTSDRKACQHQISGLRDTAAGGTQVFCFQIVLH